MATKIRSEISKKKMYWLPKHRQLELVHFCLQYPDWKMRLAILDGIQGDRLPLCRYLRKMERFGSQLSELLKNG